MDLQDYRDARWHSLLREAADLGVPEERAPALVERVLARERRRIQRADDPDPLVREALADEVLGRPERPRRRRSLAVAGLALGLVAVGAVFALTRPEPPPTDRLRSDQVPSLFGYDGPSAERLLRSRGLQVELQPFRACEVSGRVVGALPPPGTSYDAGDPITVFTAIPADVTCLTDYHDRELAWDLLDFANGRGTAPPFASQVRVYPADGRRIVLTSWQAADAATWDANGALAPVREAMDDVSLTTEHPLRYSVPAIRIVRATEGLGTCEVPESSVVGTTDVFAVLVRSADRDGCPLRIEVYRDDDGRIDALAVYRASSS